MSKNSKQTIQSRPRSIEPCHLCGRAAKSSLLNQYVFGLVCGRADCRNVRRVLEEFRYSNWRIGLPAENGDPGSPSFWSFDGELTERKFDEFSEEVK